MLQSLIDLAFDTGFFYVDWRMIVMWLVVLVLLYLAVFKEFEPLLLVPIAFGALLANLPTEGVTNKPDSPIIAPADGIVLDVFAKEGDSVFVPRVVRQIPTRISDVIKSKETAKAEDTTEATDAEVVEAGGCGSSIGAGLAIVGTVAACGVFATGKKRKED